MLYCNGNNVFVVLRKFDDELFKFSFFKLYELFVGFIIEILYLYRLER